VAQGLSFSALHQFNPLELAYLGDCVYELQVRSRLMKDFRIKTINALDRAARIYTSAASQDEVLDLIAPFLTEEEAQIIQRGKNAKAKKPRNASARQYRAATAVECLFGMLFLAGANDRIEQIADIVFELRPPSLRRNQSI